MGYTWKLEGSLKVIEDKFGEDTKPMVMLKQDQFGSVFDGPESLYKEGQTTHISYELQLGGLWQSTGLGRVAAYKSVLECNKDTWC